jgi:hypothetical protein
MYLIPTVLSVIVIVIAGFAVLFLPLRKRPEKNKKPIIWSISFSRAGCLSLNNIFPNSLGVILTSINDFYK